MLWQSSWSITGQTHKKLTPICFCPSTILHFLACFLFETMEQNPKGEYAWQLPIKTSTMFYSLDKSTTWLPSLKAIFQVSPTSFSSAPVLLSACLVLVLFLLQMLPLLVPHQALQFFRLLVLAILLDLVVSRMHQKWAARWIFLDHLGHKRKLNLLIGRKIN